MIADVFDALKSSPYINKDSPYQAESFLGAEYLDNNECPNRIVWVPTSDAILPGMISAKRRAGPLVPRQFGVREAGVTVSIWGKHPTSDDPVKDIRATELLMNSFLASVHAQLMGAYRYNGAEWFPKGGGEDANWGKHVKLSLVIFLPMYFDERVDGKTLAPMTIFGNAEVDGGMVFVKTPQGFKYPDAVDGVDYTVVAESPAP